LFHCVTEHIEVGESVRKAIHRMFEIKSKTEVEKRGWERAYWVIEMWTKFEVSNSGWKAVINWLVELIRKSKMSEGEGEVGDIEIHVRSFSHTRMG
jgi:hypothetical protein